MERLHLGRHPLLRHRLGPLRDRGTAPAEFRRLVRELAQLLFWEAAAELRLTSYTVTTPLADCAAERLCDRVGLVPILRAGLGMAEAILELIPTAQVWHLGLYRDHRTLQPITYYNRLSASAQLDVVYLLDPMLATGGSAAAAVGLLKQIGVPRIVFLGLIGAPEGLRVLQTAHPDVSIYLAALDRHLNADSYIVPGLGDAGDRQFGTLPEHD